MELADDIGILSVSRADVPDWDRIERLDPKAMPSQSPVWAGVICKAGGYRSLSRHYRFSDGTEAVLPLFARGSGFGSGFGPLSVLWSPPPAWGFGGALSNRPLAAGHIRQILDDCATLPGAAVQIRPNPLAARDWAEAAAGTRWSALGRRAHVLDLQGGFDRVWDTGFSQRSRNMARKAARAGITVESGFDDGLVAEFDRLFRLSISRWARKQNENARLAAFRGHLRDPRKKFADMARLSRGMVRIFIARQAGAAIAGIVVLYGRNAHYTRGAMDDQAVGNSGANHLLHKVAISEACERSCAHYHMGETGASASLASFKEGFGAVAIPYAEYRHETIPLLSANQHLRSLVKKTIGFRDA